MGCIIHPLSTGKSQEPNFITRAIMLPCSCRTPGSAAAEDVGQSGSAGVCAAEVVTYAAVCAM